MVFYCLKRLGGDDFKKCSRVVALFSNGVIKLNRNVSFVPISNYNVKSNVVIRMIVYAVVDLLNEAKRPYKSMIMQKVIDDFDKYANMVVFRVLKDSEYLASVGQDSGEIIQKIRSYKGRLYKSDFINAHNKLVTTLFYLKIKTASVNCTHYVYLTKFGLEVKDLIDARYVF